MTMTGLTYFFRRRIVTVLALVALALPMAAQADTPSMLPVEQVTITGKSIKPQIFALEIATELDDQITGLMNRTSMPERHGMLFLFDDVQERRFWMKDTLIPLDIIFIDNEGRIINIHPDAQPEDLTSVVSAAPARAVLELNGGAAARFGIKAGDIIHHTAFGNALATRR